MQDLRVRSEELGGSPLSLLIQTARVPDGWAVRPPASIEEWRIRLASSSRASASWLDPLRDAFAATGAASARLQRVADAGGALIATGQQPGLFGGPLYTWNKALSALALADRLEEVTGVAACPIFWAATDDADFEEARWTILAERGGSRRVRLPSAPPTGTPMSLARIGDASELLSALEMASGSATYTAPLAAARRAYADPQQTIGGAYLSLLRSILEPLGIPVIDASHPSLREAMRDLLLEAVSRASRIRDALQARDAEIVRLAGSPQVESDPSRTLVFSLQGGIRTRLPLGAPLPGGDSILSPNVLLRPIAEAEILPVAAYVAGPAELAYFAQVTAVAEELGARRPVAVPRWSCSVIEPHVQRALDRLGVPLDALRDLPAIERSVAERQTPAGISKALAEWRDSISREAARFAADLPAELSLPAESLEGARLAMLRRIDRLERRVRAAVKRQHDEIFVDLRTASGALFPEGERQERMLNFIPMLARHGPLLIDRMIDGASQHAATLVAPSPARALPQAHAEL
jgi:bacillithiol synthase